MFLLRFKKEKTKFQRIKKTNIQIKTEISNIYHLLEHKDKLSEQCFLQLLGQVRALEWVLSEQNEIKREEISVDMEVNYFAKFVNDGIEGNPFFKAQQEEWLKKIYILFKIGN